MKAEEKAMRAYADHEGFFFEDERKAYVKGYNEALKDLWHKATDPTLRRERDSPSGCSSLFSSLCERNIK